MWRLVRVAGREEERELLLHVAVRGSSSRRHRLATNANSRGRSAPTVPTSSALSTDWVTAATLMLPPERVAPMSVGGLLHRGGDTRPENRSNRISRIARRIRRGGPEPASRPETLSGRPWSRERLR